MRDKVSFPIGGEEAKFQMQGATQADGYYTIQFFARIVANEESEISIQNKCFYEFDSAFENRVIIGQKGEYTSYRLNPNDNCIQIQVLP